MGFARQVLLSGRVPGESIRILPAPGFGPRRANPSQSCVGLAVPAASTLDPAAAWALVEWLALGEPAQERFTAGFGLPAGRAALNGAREQNGMLPWQQQLAALVEQEVAETQAFTIQASPFLDGDHLAQAWSRQEERFFAGELSLDEMLAAVERLAQARKSAS